METTKDDARDFLVMGTATTAADFSSAGDGESDMKNMVDCSDFILLDVGLKPNCDV
jgi:hypothetical protein